MNLLYYSFIVLQFVLFSDIPISHGFQHGYSSFLGYSKNINYKYTNCNTELYAKYGSKSRKCENINFDKYDENNTDKYDSKPSKKLGNTKPGSPLYTPKTVNQIFYTKYLADQKCSVVIAYGSAGTGKTLFACSQAVEELKSGRIQKIILTRPIISVDKEELGFLPGGIVDKMDPWTRPLFDILLEHYSQKEIDTMIYDGVLEISPLAYMRGRTFKHAFIIADEMQNSTPNQMLMLSTRLGTESRMVITGDLNQSDLGRENGLQLFINKLKMKKLPIPEIKMVEMVNKDVQRSVIVNKILDLFSDLSTQPSVTPPVYERVADSVNIDSQQYDINISDLSHLSDFSDFSDSEYASIDNDDEYDRNIYCQPNDDDAALLPTSYISTPQHFVWEPKPL